jgi:uncharacterized Zn finger protein
MARESAAVKARRYLCEGRVILTRVTPSLVVAHVRGDGTVHRCSYLAGVWSCSCPVRTDQCAHLLAVRLVVAVDLTNP